MPIVPPALRLPARQLPALLAAALLLLGPLAAAAEALDEIRERGSIRIGVVATPPFTIALDGAELVGFEIDIGKKIAADMGVEPVFLLYPVEGVIAALEVGQLDIVAAGLGITPERALRVAFSRPYFMSGVTVATSVSRMPEVEGAETLNAPGLVIVTVPETMSVERAEALFPEAELAIVTSADEAEAAILESKADAMLATVQEARFLALRHPDRVAFPLSEPLIGSVAGIAVQRSDYELKHFLDSWIEAHHADGWLDERHHFWFETLDWVPLTDR